MMKFALLTSGSKGNSFLLQDRDLLLMIDCGSTRKHLMKSLEQLKISKDNLDALVITHDHTDHISQIKYFKDKKIYSPVGLKDIESYLVEADVSFSLKHMTVFPVALSHDAQNTTGYIFETETEKLVYITDTGYVNERYLPQLMDADYIILESNHDIEMLMATSRPPHIKLRIASDMGHLCNEDSASILQKIIGPKTKRIILAHISEAANTQEKALAVTQSALSEVKSKLNPDLVVTAAGQYELLKGGEWNEKVDLGRYHCTFHLESLSDCTVERNKKNNTGSTK